MRFVQSEAKSSFSPTSLWEGNLARAKKHFQENKCEGERPRPPPPLLSVGCSSRPRSTATRQADGAGGQRAATRNHCGNIPLPLGKQNNFSAFGEYFRNSNERDLFLLWAHGAEKWLFVLLGQGEHGDTRKARLPEAGHPPAPGLQFHLHISCTASRPPAPLGTHSHQPPPGGLMLPGLPSATTATEKG